MSWDDLERAYRQKRDDQKAGQINYEERVKQRQQYLDKAFKRHNREVKLLLEKAWKVWTNSSGTTGTNKYSLSPDNLHSYKWYISYGVGGVAHYNIEIKLTKTGSFKYRFYYYDPRPHDGMKPLASGDAESFAELEERLKELLMSGHLPVLNYPNEESSAVSCFVIPIVILLILGGICSVWFFGLL